MIGETVLHYRVTGKIGVGGMGVVWKALDTRLDREVALKVLPEAATLDPSRRERFVLEAKAASSLNHPNIVTIYEINSHGQIHFIAMELVRGMPLSAILHERKSLPAALVLKYAIQMADGLGKAHQAGIIHRDIKPSNIMVTEGGLVKILDFGLAKLTAQSRVAAASDGETTTTLAALTSPGVAVGTVPYMSPEQVFDGATVDTRSDVFSIGIVLYEMLGGRRPFIGSSSAEVIRALLTVEPPPLRSLAPGIPDECVRIVNKCLQKNVEDRYRDASELSAELRRAELGANDLFPVASAISGQPRRIDRRAWFIGIAALVAAVGALGVYSLGRKPVADSGAAVRRVSPSSSESLDRARAFLQRYDRAGNIDRAMETLGPALKQDQRNAALEAAMSEAEFRKYAVTSDKAWLEKALASGQQAVAANEDLAGAHVAFGVALAADGKNDKANDQFEKAHDVDPLNGAAVLGLAKVRAGQVRLAEAEQLYRKAVDLSPADWRPLGELGIFFYRNARYDDAIAIWKRTLQLVPDNSRLIVNLAAAYQMKGRFAESADALQRALELDPIAGTWTNLGTARFFQGRYADAVRAMEKAVELAPKNYLYWGNLGDVYRWAPGYKEKAAGAYDKAIQLAREKLASNANDISARGSLAVYLAKTGDSAGALAEMATLEQSAGKDPGVAFKAGLVYELSHNRKEALAALERAVKAGYSKHEVANEPEFASLRQDTRYRRILFVSTR